MKTQVLIEALRKDLNPTLVKLIEPYLPLLPSDLPDELLAGAIGQSVLTADDAKLLDHMIWRLENGQWPQTEVIRRARAIVPAPADRPAPPEPVQEKTTAAIPPEILAIPPELRSGGTEHARVPDDEPETPTPVPAVVPVQSAPPAPRTSIMERLRRG